ncbi:MAG: helix-turn-helix transcriptional regulator [Chloroflexi bacterium]|nr:helix-turn-helix transcriptional regulator [Chloroflexota bacterium]
MKLKEFRKQLEESQEYLDAKSELQLQFNFAKAVLRARLKKGWSQEQLADAIGTKQANISRIESGLSNPSLNIVQKLSNILDFKINIVDDQFNESEYVKRSIAISRPSQEYKTAVWFVPSVICPENVTWSLRSETEEKIFA